LRLQTAMGVVVKATPSLRRSTRIPPSRGTYFYCGRSTGWGYFCGGRFAEGRGILPRRPACRGPRLQGAVFTNVGCLYGRGVCIWGSFGGMGVLLLESTCLLGCAFCGRCAICRPGGLGARLIWRSTALFFFVSILLPHERRLLFFRLPKARGYSTMIKAGQDT